MPKFLVETQRPPGLDEFLARVARLTSKRKVRPVVIPSGKRARGDFPSIKAPGYARFESLLEQDVLRVIEVGTWARVMRTHPAVLALPGEPVMHYTPDVQVESDDGGILVETKATFFLTKATARDRLRTCVRRLRDNGVKLVVISEVDVQSGNLQDELKQLLRIRPIVGRYRSRIDTSLWNPLKPAVVDFEVERRWRAAQRECDALLARVMRRDPDDLIAASCR